MLGMIGGKLLSRRGTRDERRLTISVMVPADAPIGMWEAAIETSYEDERWSTKRRVVDIPLYIIFNPYIIADPT